MRAAKPTPGPWEIGDKQRAQDVFAPNEGLWIAHCYRHPERPDEHKSNAFLIAAAPKMYDALRGIVAFLPEDVRRFVEQLLANARGEK